ncbi:MAG: protein kinase [Chloroflexota bacterium]
MADLIGKSLGQYQIKEQIGAGGMATVFKAFQESINRHVAVKILPIHFANDPNFVKRFTQEAQAIAALEHPHIVPVYDFGTSNDLTYMAMRYVEGGTLSDLMGTKLSDERIVELISSVAKALDYAHSQGVVHRDIKPSNVLIGNHGEALLSDFGIAKMMGGNEGGTQLTGTGSILGTPDYMAPEQASGNQVDGRSDIYSLGVVLYELLTGHPPYQAKTPLAVVMMHINEPLPPPRQINPDIPEPLEQVVIKAMAKDPEKRYQTANEMAAALQDALLTLKSTSQTGSMPTSSTTPDLTAPPPVTEAPAKKSRGMMWGVIAGIGVIGLLCVAAAVGAFLVFSNSGDDENQDDVAGVTTVEIAATEEAQPTNTPIPEPEPTDGQINAAPTSAQATADEVPTIPGLDGAILLAEDFGFNQNNWPAGESEDEFGTIAIDFVDGRYQLNAEAAQDTVRWFTPDSPEYDNFVLSVDAFPIEYNAPFAYGLVFRNDNDDAFYTFEIDQEGFFLDTLTRDNEWESVIGYTDSSAIVPDGPNQLVVKANGPSLTFYINGVEVAEIDDTSTNSGSVGLVLEFYEGGNEASVAFDNFVIREISPSEKLAETSTDTSTSDTPSGEILFTETFDSDTNGWATGEFDGDYALEEITIENGIYTINVDGKPEQLPYIERNLPNQEFSDFVLTVDAVPQDTDEHYSYGIVFREDENGRVYSFEIGNDQLYSIWLFDDEWITLKDWSSADAINIGETNTLKVEAKGSTLKFYVNDELLTTIEDDTLSEGAVGLVVDIFEADTSATVSFDNLIIQTP